jgi:hypothetical protein
VRHGACATMELTRWAYLIMLPCFSSRRTMTSRSAVHGRPSSSSSAQVQDESARSLKPIVAAEQSWFSAKHLIPSYSPHRIFFRATTSPVAITLALYTTPYVPSPICTRDRHAHVLGEQSASRGQAATRAYHNYWQLFISYLV